MFITKIEIELLITNNLCFCYEIVVNIVLFNVFNVFVANKPLKIKSSDIIKLLLNFSQMLQLYNLKYYWINFSRLN